MEFNNQNDGRTSWWLFLLGLGSATKVFILGALAISEIIVFLVAPIVLLKNYSRMREEGFMRFVLMIGLLVGGLFVSAGWNHSPLPFVLKMFAIFYSFFAHYIVFYRLLRNNFRGLGWFFMGAALSGVITIWAFNPTVDVSSSGFQFIANADMETIINGPLFWISKVRSFGQLPIMAAYMKTPIAYSCVAPILFTLFAMFTTISGRAQSMCVLLGAAMIFMGRKSRFAMRRIGKHFCLLCIVGVFTLLCYKMVYSYAALHGYLGEAALSKYVVQTNRGSSALSMLMAGRSEFFIALSAIKDRPIVGFGPRAEDTKGYAEKFLLKYGTSADIGFYLAGKEIRARLGIVPEIPTHSHIMAAWLWCGLPGLVFFLWVLYVMLQHVRKTLWVVPQWFGYFSIFIPSIVWSIFFNPFGARWIIPLMMVCIFYARAIAKGAVEFPYGMEMEARKYD